MALFFGAVGNVHTVGHYTISATWMVIGLVLLNRDIRRAARR
jgi:hypothetical protein